MPSRPDPAHEKTVPLHVHALDDIRYIRSAMERAGAFTAVPGRGTVAIGVTALAAALLAALQPDFAGWLAVWLGEAMLGAVIGAWSLVRKARRLGVSLWSGPGRKFVLGFSPPLVVGALLTIALVRVGATDALPGTWLLLYGTGVVAGGAFSIPVVPLQGLGFLLLGAIALFAPPSAGDVLLAMGFGALNVFFGAVIAGKYGG